MTASVESFERYRLDAAREFAQTMIVVDDEADQREVQAEVVKPLKTPSRTRLALAESHVQPANVSASRHSLDAKTLIDKAMDLGLICSVLRPHAPEKFHKRVTNAAERADIVCLDWELHSDGGDSATKIIKEIVKSDEKKNGRLRLIAIYTGDITNNRILEKIYDAFPEKFRREHGVKREQLQIVSNNGLKIVCLFKSHGIALTDSRNRNQLDEAALPERLQKEFAELSEGLLSNIALTTIASIRRATHHVLSKFDRKMDGPYLHHRATIDNADDAEEYAISVVLSELKSVVDKYGVAERFAGRTAIRSWVRHVAPQAGEMTLHYEKKSGAATFKLSVDDVVKLVSEGCKAVHGQLQGDKPSKKCFEDELTTLFCENRAAAKRDMQQFAVLTGVRSHPGSYLYKNGVSKPHLGLGTVVQAPDRTYLLCLQASCDSVRVACNSAFLFVPLNETHEHPEHVVPILTKGEVRFVGLSTSSYAHVKSINFSPMPGCTVISAQKMRGRNGLYFKSDGGSAYRWIADLKRNRALRTVQRLGQEMSRLGFDEFEPFRLK